MPTNISSDDVRRADDNPGTAAYGANPETHTLQSYPLLDWLRFVLASMVALGHENFPFPGPISAGLAVDVFLALSGWLIGGILIATPLPGLPRFFFNRATRIWIPYAFAILLVYGLAAVHEGIGLHWWKYLFYDATFTHFNFTVFPRAKFEMPLDGTGNHFWSLSIEEQFYLLAPILMLGLAFGKKLWLWPLIGAAMLLFGMRAAPIGLGVAAAVAQRDYGNWHLSRYGRPLVLALTAGLFAVMWVHDTRLVHGLFAIALILALAVTGRRGRIGLFAGAISYPLYLNHWIGGFVANLLAKHVGGLPAGMGIAVAYTGAVATGVVTWALIDRWVMAHRAGWYSERRGRMLGAYAYAVVAIGLAGGFAIRFSGG